MSASAFRTVAPAGGVSVPSSAGEFYQEFTARNRGLLSADDQQLLRNAVFLVAGCGSTGGAVVEPLVRLGAERLVLAEPDSYELHNLNRQHARLCDLGRNKAVVLAEWAVQVNPHARIEVDTAGVTPGNAARHAAAAAVIFDAIDVTAASALSCKYLLHKEARLAGVPVISGYDIGGVQLILAYDYRRPRTRVLGGRVADRDLAEPMRFLARVVPLRALPAEIFPELRRQLDGQAAFFPQLVYSALLFGALAPRLAVDLLAGRPVRRRIIVDVHNLPRTPCCPAADGLGPGRGADQDDPGRTGLPPASCQSPCRAGDAMTTGVDHRGTRPAGPGPGGSAPALAEAADAFAEEVISCGAAVRVPDLLASPPPGTLYRVAGRHGVAVAAVPTTSLARDEIAGLLRFRLAQYLEIGFVDRQAACSRQMRTEPESIMAPADVHVVAGVPGTGEILCYAVVEQPPPTPPGSRVRSPDRALFPVEQVHGAGLYNRLPILPDLPVAKVREMGRFVRNQRPEAGRELVARAVVEVCVAVFRLMAGPMRMDVDALIGDLEENVAKHHLDFLHVPCRVIHGTVPYPGGASHLYPRYQLHTVYPFACLVSDIATALPRLHAVEEALATPGQQGLLSLLQLRSQGTIAPSTLCTSPHGQAEPSLPQQQTGMHERSRLLEAGAWLRQVRPFTSLSAAEAALVCASLQRVTVRAGQVITRQGEQADALYIVEAGQAAVDLADGAGASQRIGSVQTGQCCGHAAILDGAEHPVTVTAATDMTVLRLSKATHQTCLYLYPEVTQQLAHDALRLLAQVDHQHRHNPARAAVPGGQCGCGDSCACTGHVRPAGLSAPAGRQALLEGDTR